MTVQTVGRRMSKKTADGAVSQMSFKAGSGHIHEAHVDDLIQAAIDRLDLEMDDIEDFNSAMRIRTKLRKGDRQ